MTEDGSSAMRGESPKGPAGILSIESGGLSESELVRRAPSAPDVFATLYRRHYPAIQRYLRRRLGDRHLVEDAVAETFLSALKQIGRYEDRGLPFRSWLYRIATGEAQRQHKRAARIAMAQLEHEPEASGEPDSGSADTARAALLLIAPRFQAVLALYYFEELSVGEIARTLRCREGTIKSRLARGREALRNQLARMGVRS